MSTLLERFLSQLEQGRDSAILRLSIATQLHAAERYAEAIEHLRRALELNPAYTAVWMALGQAQERAGQSEAAMQTYQSGIATADQNGDRQAQRQMAVYLKRLEKARA